MFSRNNTNSQKWSRNVYHSSARVTIRTIIHSRKPQKFSGSSTSEKVEIRCMCQSYKTGLYTWIKRNFFVPGSTILRPMFWIRLSKWVENLAKTSKVTPMTKTPRPSGSSSLQFQKIKSALNASKEVQHMLTWQLDHLYAQNVPECCK
jgi:hypothetical protein